MSQGTGARNVEENTTGHISDLLVQGSLESDADLRAQVAALTEQVRLILDGVNGKLSFGDGRQSSQFGNNNAVNVQYNFVTTSTVEAIPHNLGRKPSGWWQVGFRPETTSGGAVPLLVACGSDGDILYGGGDNAVNDTLSDWDNRMIYFRAEGDSGWLPALYRIVLF